MQFFKVMYHWFVIGLLFLCSDYSFSEEFRLGTWCLTGGTATSLIIEQYPPSSGNWVLQSDEKIMLDTLRLNYLIGCTAGVNTEKAMNAFGVEKSGDFQATLEWAPRNDSLRFLNNFSTNPAEFQVWKTIRTNTANGSTADTNNTTWRYVVNKAFADMDSIYDGSSGVHSFLAGAESYLETPARYPMLRYIVDAIHNNATDVPALVQDDYSAAEYLDSLFTIVDDIDIFNYHWYVFDEDLDSSGADFQDALDDYVHSISYAQTELQDHYGY